MYMKIKKVVKQSKEERIYLDESGTLVGAIVEKTTKKSLFATQRKRQDK